MSPNIVPVTFIIALFLSLSACGIALQWRIVEVAKIEAAR